MMLTQKSQEELERIQLRKESLTLDLKHKTTSDVEADDVQTTETETCDTFHTANSDCSFASALPSPFPPRQEHFSSVDNEEQLPTHGEENEDGKTLMSDSGVCLENSNNNNNNHSKVSSEPQTSSSQQKLHLAKHISNDGDNLSTNSSQNNNMNFYEQILHSQMEKLREEIAMKKAEIMRILETGGDKIRLDGMINELQAIQKEFVKMEMRLENSRGS